MTYNADHSPSLEASRLHGWHEIERLAILG